MKKLFLFFSILIVIILEQTLFNLHFLSNIKPELFTILVVNYAFLENNKLEGYINCSLIGFFEDILTNQILGYNILIKSSMFLIIYFLKNKIFFQNIFFKSFISTIINFFEFIVGFILGMFFSFYSFNPFENNMIFYYLSFFIVSVIFIAIFDKFYKKFFLANES